MIGRLAVLVLLALGCGRRPAAPTALASAAAVVHRARPPLDPGFIGVVVAGERLELEPHAEGRIAEVFVRPGDRVARGAPIARLEIEGLTHDLAAARAAYGESARRLARRRKLARGKLAAVTVEEVDAARREMLQERARLARLEAARVHAVVTAPFEGIIAERYLSPGALAGPGRPVARLVGHDEPRVRFAIPEDRAGAVAVGATVEVKIAPAGLLARGRVTGVSPDVDASSRMVFAAASLEPHPGPALGTGLLARVFLAPAPARER